MEENDAVLSDVHTNIKYEILSQNLAHLSPRLNQKLTEGGVPSDLQNLAVTRFEIPISMLWPDASKPMGQHTSFTGESLQTEKDSPNISLVKDTCPDVDGDGDFLLKRRNSYPALDAKGDNLNGPPSSWHESQVINIVHHLATERDGVGHQVWQGALLLCEFALSHPHLFQGRVIVDLGAGVGLTSIIAGLQAKTVFCTDLHSSILRLSKHNADSNSEMLLGDRNRIKVRKLDWMSDDLKSIDVEPVTTESASNEEVDDFSWTNSDREELQSLDTLIAADVVYDEDLTEGFFRTFHSFMSKPPSKVLYLSLEKRLIFTVSDLEICCPAYAHFGECLQDLSLCTDHGLRYHVERLPTDFPQYFSYNRIPQLELWKISTTFEHSSKDVT